MPLILDTQAYLDTVCDLLNQGHTHVPVTIAGSSMTPFLDPGDTVFLDLPQGPVRPGDVVLFTRSSGRYILHRVIKVRPDGSLVILGDAQLLPELLPDPAQVRGLVVGATHGKKQLSPRSLRWRFFAGPWAYVRRLRPYVNRIRNGIRRHTKLTL